MLARSNFAPPQTVVIRSRVPYFTQLRSVYRPYGPLQGGLGVAAETPIWRDVEWWGKTIATAGITFAALYILAKI